MAALLSFGMSTDQELLASYDAFRPTYDAYVERLSSLLEDLLASEGVQLLSITGRVKDRDSVIRKIAAGGGKYESILDITDIAGLRVITYFADDVDKIGQVVRREFDVIDQHSVDKRAVLPADLNARIAKPGGGIFKVDGDVINRHAMQLSIVGIRTIGELKAALNEHAARIERFGVVWSKRRGGLHSVILPIVYLEYLLVVDSNDPATVRDFLSVASSVYRGDFVSALTSAVRESDADNGAC